MSKQYMMCSYCHSIGGGHTMACQAIHIDTTKPPQIPVPEDSPWMKRRRTEEAEKEKSCQKS